MHVGLDKGAQPVYSTRPYPGLFRFRVSLPGQVTIYFGSKYKHLLMDTRTISFTISFRWLGKRLWERGRYSHCDAFPVKEAIYGRFQPMALRFWRNGYPRSRYTTTTEQKRTPEGSHSHLKCKDGNPPITAYIVLNG